ncbi:MAG: hypothetical protein PHI31_06575 [Desulfuromonadaceae bacterium]|nr:hypothetical protein [Desulfuromonadaceae bacterium]
MKSYTQGLIGMDVKPRRNTRVRKNHFKPSYSHWLYPAIITLICLIVVIGIH